MRLEAGTGLRCCAPQPGPQEATYFSPADVVGFGGSAGGGKSFLALVLAANAHRRSLILRRETTQGRALIDDARSIFGMLGRFNENTGIWRDLPGDRQIEFSGVKNPGDEQKHKGRPKDLLFVDEADQFSEDTVRFLMGWVRTSIPGQKCRTVLAFNPPNGAEGRWLLRFFAPWLAYLFPKKFSHRNPAAPGELRWFATVGDGQEIECADGQPFEQDGKLVKPKSRTFIPARVEDNAYLMVTGYDAQLEALPEPLRSQLRYGDFTAGLEDASRQVIPTAWVEAAMARWTEAGHQGRPLSAIGVDVARGGRDRTVLAPRHGFWFARPHQHPGKTTQEGQVVADLIGLALAPQVQALVVIDVIGIGASPFDECRRRGFKVYGCDFRAATSATDRKGVLRFKNLRAFAWWSMRELLDPANGHPVQLPPDDELLAELTAPLYMPTSSGIKIEEKEDVEKRLGRSPDLADAVIYSILMPG